MTPHEGEAAASSSEPPDFSPFLRLQIWVEPNGMALTVMSALARLNLDPPREALRLATIPRVKAAVMLTQTIARSRNLPAAADIAEIAARAIRLLPDVTNAPLVGAAAEVSQRRAWRWVRTLDKWQLWAIVLFAVCVLKYVWF